MGCGAVVPAAGSSRRMGGLDKTLWDLGGRPVIAWVLDALAAASALDEIVVAAGPHNAAALESIVGEHPARARITLCPGGETRQDSVAAAAARLSPAIDLVLIHDAARPLVTETLVSQAIEAGATYGAAVAAVPVSDTIKQIDESGRVIATPDRDYVVAAQTPQVFRRDWLQVAQASHGATTRVTDEACLLELAGYPVRIFPGSPENLKLTTPVDLALAEALLRVRGRA